MAERMRQIHTEFGSGWRGIIPIPDRTESRWRGPKIHPSFEEGLIGPGSIPAPERKPNLSFQWLEQGFVRHEEEDFASHLPGYLLPNAVGHEVIKKSAGFIRRNWKMATAIGLAGLYLSKPLSLFSGRDDEANTIEGLRHGGLSQHMRRNMTPFGSGWDPLRALAKEAGMSFEKLTKNSSFREALTKGTMIKELGKGSYGEVHLMESSFKLGEKEHKFTYARKIALKGDLRTEIKAQKKLQDLNAPNVYGGDRNIMYMESFSGVNASGHLMQGKQLPESFIKDLETFVPEMHRRGIAHMDMTRDVNRLAEKAGRYGEALPHNIILTPEGRAGVIDFGLVAKPGKPDLLGRHIHQAYVKETLSTNAELDMALVTSLRKNEGKLTPGAIQKIDHYRSASESVLAPTVAPPMRKSISSRVRTNEMAAANRATAKHMFNSNAGRKARTTFRSTTHV